MRIIAASILALGAVLVGLGSALARPGITVLGTMLLLWGAILSALNYVFSRV